MQMQEYSYEGGESSLELMPTSIGQEDCGPGIPSALESGIPI
ncbi:MAG: hypothetical protein ACFWT1_02830 [Selenomonas sp.]